MSLPDIIGLLGVASMVIAFTLFQLQKIQGGTLYSSMNAFGSICVLYSLVYDFNMSAFIMESIWLVMSLYGIIILVKDTKWFADVTSALNTLV
jgi:multidrug transporter EmrE-like cation transporter